jgi:hypothetical protein
MHVPCEKIIERFVVIEKEIEKAIPMSVEI